MISYTQGIMCIYLCTFVRMRVNAFAITNISECKCTYVYIYPYLHISICNCLHMQSLYFIFSYALRHFVAIIIFNINCFKVVTKKYKVCCSKVQSQDEFQNRMKTNIRAIATLSVHSTIREWIKLDQ